MFKFLSKLLCKHSYYTLTNISGIDVNLLGGCKSISKCKKCGNIKYNKKNDYNCSYTNYYLWDRK